MAYELVRTIVQKILQDKILLGLVIIGILGIFIGGASLGDNDEKAVAKASDEHGAQAQPPGQLPGQAPGHAPAPAPQQAAALPQGQPALPPANALNPALATDFVKWWIVGAMDYAPQTAAKSHNDAMVWMTPEGARDFSTLLWTPQIAENVCTGRVIAAFHPTAIQAQAINPDGSVVVGVAGTVVIQGQGQPMSQQFLGNFLIRQDKDGLRVARAYTRNAPLAIY